MSVIEVEARPLSREAFAPYGEVIETRGRRSEPRNNGTALGFPDLAEIDIVDGSPCLSIYRAQPCEPPLEINILERHPLCSQAFVPMESGRFLIVVAEAPEPQALAAFISRCGQGISYRRGTWHHPLMALDRTTDFLVIDRKGEGDNCEVVSLSRPARIDLP